MSDGVLDHMLDQVLNGVLDEVPDGGSDNDSTLLQENHTLDIHKHRNELNLSQNHCKNTNNTYLVRIHGELIYKPLRILQNG
jgi:hypothetical protein